MRSSVMMTVALAGLAGSFGCSSDETADFVPLVSSTLMGKHRGEAFTPDAGIAFQYGEAPTDRTVLVLGIGNITCEGFAGTVFPDGTYAYVVPGEFGGPSELSVSTYTDVNVSIQKYTARSRSSVGTGGGTVVITAVDATMIAGSIDWSYVDEGTELGSISGEFVVTRCP